MIEGIDRQDRFTQFDTGAVRDIQEDKGRCDLAPIGVEALLFAYWEDHFPFDVTGTEEPENILSMCMHSILCNIDYYMWKGNTNNLLAAICTFINAVDIWHNIALNDPSIIWNETTPLCLALLEVSKHYKQGAQKYGERNWEKGIPLHSYIDSGVRHLMKYKAGYTDERHDLAFIWNLMGCIYTQNFNTNNSLKDIPYFNDKIFNKLKPKKEDIKENN